MIFLGVIVFNLLHDYCLFLTYVHNFCVLWEDKKPTLVDNNVQSINQIKIKPSGQIFFMLKMVQLEAKKRACVLYCLLLQVKHNTSRLSFHNLMNPSFDAVTRTQKSSFMKLSMAFTLEKKQLQMQLICMLMLNGFWSFQCILMMKQP